jgi:hypothetical protein
MGFDHPLARVLAKGCLEEMMALGSVPVTHYLVRDDDATGRQQIFNHSRAERKPKGQPDEVGNHFGRKPMAAIKRTTSGLYHAA